MVIGFIGFLEERLARAHQGEPGSASDNMALSRYRAWQGLLLWLRDVQGKKGQAGGMWMLGLELDERWKSTSGRQFGSQETVLLAWLRCCT